MGGGGMGGGQPSAATALPRLVRNLSILEKVQNKGLSAQQSQVILPVLKEVKSADKLPEKDAADRMKTIEAVLTEPQKQALDELQPRGGGGGGRGGGGGMMGGGGPGGMVGRGGPVAMGGGGGMGGMGGGRPDPERPFASERNKKALDDLVAQLGSSK